MTGEEAIKALYELAQGICLIETTPQGQAMRMAIEALEQKPCEQCEVGNPCLYCKHEFEEWDSDNCDGCCRAHNNYESSDTEIPNNSDAISRDEVIDILLNEMECIQRASDEECNRDCAKCDLLRDTNKILQAYRISIKALEHPEENVVAIVPCGDAIDRAEAIRIASGYCHPANVAKELAKLPPVTPKPKMGHCKDCKWWKDSDGVFRRGIGAESRCPINREEVYEGNGYCFLYEAKMQGVSEDGNN